MIPPSSSPRTPPVYRIPAPGPHYPAHHPAYTGYSGPHFPSHFYPDKLYQYWHHYYPRY